MCFFRIRGPVLFGYNSNVNKKYFFSLSSTFIKVVQVTFSNVNKINMVYKEFSGMIIN